MKHIYIYETPESKKEGFIKIGDAENVDSRISQQFNQASVFNKEQRNYEKLYEIKAIRNDNTEFRDHQIHEILKYKNIETRTVEETDNFQTKTKTEWFKISIEKAKHIIEEYINGKEKEQIDINRFNTFSLREEQEDAVDLAEKYLKRKNDSDKNILWNAKMRFGKTFSAYKLMQRMKYKKTLIVTYKPAVRDAWKEDLENHMDFADYTFYTTDNMKNEDYMVIFVSFQDILGEGKKVKDVVNLIKDKHKELFDIEWDLIIIDEFHYGSSTEKARKILRNSDKDITLKDIELDMSDEEKEDEKESDITISVEKNLKTKNRLFLSGTPFKALANDQFEEDAIFNWTYVDEQKAKENFIGENNPYAALPTIKMYVYELSDHLKNHIQETGNNEFSLNYFFRVKKDETEFEDKESVILFLDLLSGTRKSNLNLIDQLDEEKDLYEIFPFDKNSKINKELNHTLWYLNNVASVNALEKMLNEHSVFSDYTIINVAGNNSKGGSEALSDLKKKMYNKDKTITLTVGRLTTGVSVKEWTGVLFLRDIESPESYFQTAFRAQTPYKDIYGNILKHFAYIIDFSPLRSFRLLTSYSEELTKNEENILKPARDKIADFIKYLPVLKYQDNKLVQLDANEVFAYESLSLSPEGLSEKIKSNKNIDLSRDVFGSLFKGGNEDKLNKCKDIFDKIKKYRKNTSIEKDINLDKLKDKDQLIKKLKTKKDDSEEKIKNKVENEEKAFEDEAKKGREILKTLLSRIPLFMYLTDEAEENLKEVMNVGDELDLFRKVTGITTDDFEFLISVGILKNTSIDGYIIAFLKLEEDNYHKANTLFLKE